jgi:ferredoxin
MKDSLAYVKITDDCISCAMCMDVCPAGIIGEAGDNADPSQCDYSEDHNFVTNLYACNAYRCELQCMETCLFDAPVLMYLPAAPTGVAASGSAGIGSAIKVSWTAVPGLVYEVYAKDIYNGNTWAPVGTVSTAFFIDTAYGYLPTSGTTYRYYKVRAKNSSGRYSNFSAAVYARAAAN